MELQSALSGIRNSWAVVNSLELGDSFSNPRVLPVNVAFRDVSLGEDVSYEEIYTTGLELVHYNFRLTDYSYFQFSWTGLEDYRYAYYPNPFERGRTTTERLEELRELVRAEMLDLEEFLSLASDRHSVNRLPLLRYEYSTRQYRAFAHPSSHFHIGHPPSGRWAVAKELSPLSFTLLVLKHYYSREWEEMGADPRDERGHRLESHLIRERRRLDDVGADCFSADERRSFYFA